MTRHHYSLPKMHTCLRSKQEQLDALHACFPAVVSDTFFIRALAASHLLFTILYIPYNPISSRIPHITSYLLLPLVYH